MTGVVVGVFLSFAGVFIGVLWFINRRIHNRSGKSSAA